MPRHNTLDKDYIIVIKGLTLKCTTIIYIFQGFQNLENVVIGNKEKNMEDNMFPGQVRSREYSYYLGTIDWSPMLKDKSIQGKV